VTKIITAVSDIEHKTKGTINKFGVQTWYLYTATWVTLMLAVVYSTQYTMCITHNGENDRFSQSNADAAEPDSSNSPVSRSSNSIARNVAYFTASVRCRDSSVYN